MRVVIIGAGGFGREIHDVLEAERRAGDEPLDVAGFVADYDLHLDEVAAIGSRVLGPIDELPVDAAYLIGVGSPSARRTLDERAAALGARACRPVVHETATTGRAVELGDGTVLCAHAAITTNVRLGRHVHVNLHADIGHDCELGDYVTLAPGARVSGRCDLGDEVELGTNAVVLPGVRIGAGATIGAGAVVTKDVPPGVVAVGVPARW